MPSLFVQNIAQRVVSAIPPLRHVVSTTVLRGLAPPTKSPHVDLARYLGTWHEIARFPNRFERECVYVTANYALAGDGEIAITNRCLDAQGTPRVAHGRARVLDDGTNAKLKVSFFGPFFVGAYWVLEHDDEYSYAVVGHPGRDYLWILSRTQTMSDALYERLVSHAASNGFETHRLVRARYGNASV